MDLCSPQDFVKPPYNGHDKGSRFSREPCRLSKNPWRVREGRSSLELLIVPGGVYGGRGTIFAEENLIFQSKNRFLAVFALGNLKVFLQKLAGVVVAGELVLPSTSLSKTFWTS